MGLFSDIGDAFNRSIGRTPAAAVPSAPAAPAPAPAPVSGTSGSAPVDPNFVATPVATPDPAMVVTPAAPIASAPAVAPAPAPAPIAARASAAIATSGASVLNNYNYPHLRGKGAIISHKLLGMIPGENVYVRIDSHGYPHAYTAVEQQYRNGVRKTKIVEFDQVQGTPARVADRVTKALAEFDAVQSRENLPDFSTTVIAAYGERKLSREGLQDLHQANGITDQTRDTALQFADERKQQRKDDAEVVNRLQKTGKDTLRVAGGFVVPVALAAGAFTLVNQALSDGTKAMDSANKNKSQSFFNLAWKGVAALFVGVAAFKTLEGSGNKALRLIDKNNDLVLDTKAGIGSTLRNVGNQLGKVFGSYDATLIGGAVDEAAKLQRRPAIGATP